MSASDIKEDFFNKHPELLKYTREGETFAGCVYDDDVFVQIANERKWADDTTRRYLNDLNMYVFSEFQNKPLKQIEKSECVKIVNRVIKKRRDNNLSATADLNTQRHIGFLLGKIFEKAAAKELCENILWGSRYNLFTDSESSKQKSLKEELVVLPKSLTIAEEKAVAKRVLTDHEESGELIALALMFCLGVRENEACALDFGDIKRFRCDKAFYYMQISKSSMDRNSRKVKFSGKTKNAVRLVPIPSELYKLLIHRKEYVRDSLKEKNPHIERYPIACKENQFEKRLTPGELSKAGTRLFQLISEDINDPNENLEDKIAFIDENLDSDDEQAELDTFLVEKSPTAYLFRRNAATHLSILGLDQNEIEYIMGHDIKDERDSRNFFKNEDKLYPIALKMAQRPIVNCLDQKHELKWDEQKNYIAKQNVEQLDIEIPVMPDDVIVVKISQREPSAKLRVSIHTDEGSPMKGEYSASPVIGVLPETVNVLTYYQDHYRDD